MGKEVRAVDRKRLMVAAPVAWTGSVVSVAAQPATNSSERSLKALDIAVSLARQFGAAISLLHVNDTMIPPGRYESADIRRLRREVWLDGKRRRAALASKQVKPLVAVKQHVAQGSPYAVIVDFAAKAQVDLIVMASEGRTGLGRVLIGSIAERVVRLAGFPVLMVRAHKL